MNSNIKFQGSSPNGEVRRGLPRGIRNNNPLNIRHNPANKWLGLRPEQTDPDFCQFESMIYGVRAAFRLLLNYRRNGYNTARKIITRWAPPTENNTEAYIRSVALFLDVDKVVQVDADYIHLAQAMAWVETGRQLSDNLMWQAWELFEQREQNQTSLSYAESREGKTEGQMLWDEAVFAEPFRDHHEPEPAEE